MTLSRLKALDLLYECDGDEIWSIEHCQARGVPEVWIEELQDCFESNHARDSETIFEPNDDNKLSPTNQYEGIRALDLAMKLGEFFNVDVNQLQAMALSRSHLLQQIRDEVEES